HGMKIDVKRKIYLVSIEKFDNNGSDVRDGVFCCRLLSALPKISSVIRSSNENDSCYYSPGLLSSRPWRACSAALIHP
ncbi:MAG: hypothetical protein RSD99_20905, partial [Janthinobacterium sp.]